MGLQAEYTSTLMHWRHWIHVLSPGGTEIIMINRQLQLDMMIDSLLHIHTFNDCNSNCIFMSGACLRKSPTTMLGRCLWVVASALQCVFGF